MIAAIVEMIKPKIFFHEKEKVCKIKYDNKVMNIYLASLNSYVNKELFFSLLKKNEILFIKIINRLNRKKN